MRRIRDHLTYANVMATIAVFLVLSGGTAVALNGQNTVQSDDLGPGAQVKAPDLAANAVNSADVANESLTGADIKNKSGVDTCVNTVRLGNLCFRAENQVRPWFEAAQHCANLNLRLPSLGEARALATKYDLPYVDQNEYFWTDEFFESSGGGSQVFVVADGGTNNVATVSSPNVETACVTTPTN